MRAEYLPFEIRFERPQDDGFPFSVDSEAGQARGTLRIPTDDAYTQAITKLGILLTTRDLLKQLGERLFDLLFQGQVRDVYSRLQGRLGLNQGIRLILSIDADLTAVAKIPWEFIREPGRSGPLAMLDVSIVRYLPRSAVEPQLKASLPLKVLLSGAETAPDGSGQKPDVAAALASAKEALSGLGDKIDLVIEPHLTRSKFRRLLRQGFHVWHFIGHGTLNGDTNAGALCFEVPAPETESDYEEMSAEELGILLDGSGVRLAVLNACSSAQLATNPFLSVAPALIQGQVPGVIAMQFQVSQDGARAFSEEFYLALAEGHPLDACVTEGRKAVIGEISLGQPDWGIPVVYTRAEEGLLFDLPKTAGQSTAPNTLTTLQAATVTPEPAPDDKAATIAALRSDFELSKRRYFVLAKQRAIMGISADPSITIQIEDLQKNLQKLAKDIEALGGDPPSLIGIL